MLSGRAETPTQSRILTYVRDEGPLSRMDLASRLNVSRTTVAAEVGRLVELGLAEDGGPAASRGGRRSTLVDLDAGLRFVGIELGATSMRVAMTDGRLGVLARAASPMLTSAAGPSPCSVRPSSSSASCWPSKVSNVRPASASECRVRSTSSPGCRCRRRSCRGGTATRCATRCRASSARPVLLDNDVNVMALGEQHTGVARSASDFLFVKIGTGIGCGIVVDRHLYRGADGCAGDIGHIRLEQNGPLCACGNHGCLEAFFGGAALARDATAAARSGRSAVLAELLEERRRAHGRARRVGDRAGGRRGAPARPRRGSTGRRRCWPTWCPSSTPA